MLTEFLARTGFFNCLNAIAEESKFRIHHFDTDIKLKRLAVILYIDLRDGENLLTALFRIFKVCFVYMLETEFHVIVRILYHFLKMRVQYKNVSYMTFIGTRYK